jgi:uncharacterized protein
VDFTAGLIEFAIFTAAILLWAKRSKLDLGTRPPDLRAAWPWILFFIAWLGAEWAIVTAYPVEVDPEWQEELERLSLLEDLALTVLLGPVFEELLFRGALFAALIRRWGISVAAIVPSALWGLIHVQYEAWYAVSIACSGVILAMIRWKSGSLYVPIALHSGFNLFDLLMSRFSFG